MKRTLLILLLLAMAAVGRGQVAIGKWRDCLDYSTVYHVALAGDRVYAAARGGVFCYDTVDNTLTRMAKGAGLSDVGVAAMAYSEATGKDIPIKDTDIMIHATPEELGSALGTIIGLRAQFYNIPAGEPEEKPKKGTRQRKNA